MTSPFFVLQSTFAERLASKVRGLKRASRKDTISLRHEFSLRRPTLLFIWPPQRPSVAIALLSGAVLMAAGCGGGTMTSRVQVGQIAFTDVNGKTAPAVTSLNVSSGTYLDTTIMNDPQMLGANWSVTCASALPAGTPLPPGQTVDESCGTFTAVHTATAPVPSFASSGAGIVTFYQAPTAVPTNGTVTISAAATVDPSVQTSLTLTVTGLPISVGFAPGPPSSLAINGTAQIGALVSNDSAAGGVKWSVTCASIACGAFSPAETPSITQTTYTAPDAVPVGGTVTITATSVTDPTKFASAQVTISQTASAALPATVSRD